MPEVKCRAVQEMFGSVIGTKLIGYTTAEIKFDHWEPWPDLPIRLQFDTYKQIAVSWSHFDNLWLADDMSLPFDTSSDPVRWVQNAIAEINPVIGSTLRSVVLQPDYIELSSKNIEIWTRLQLHTDNGCLEIFNALDENGYRYFVE